MATIRRILATAVALAFAPACGSVDTSRCEPACAHAIDACPDQPWGSLASCTSGCEQDLERQQAEVPTCADKLSAYLACFTDAKLTCVSDPYTPLGPAAASCGSSLQEFLAGCTYPGGE